MEFLLFLSPNPFALIPLYFNQLSGMTWFVLSCSMAEAGGGSGQCWGRGSSACKPLGPLSIPDAFLVPLIQYQYHAFQY